MIFLSRKSNEVQLLLKLDFGFVGYFLISRSCPKLEVEIWNRFKASVQDSPLGMVEFELSKHEEGNLRIGGWMPVKKSESGAQIEVYLSTIKLSDFDLWMDKPVFLSTLSNTENANLKVREKSLSPKNDEHQSIAEGNEQIKTHSITESDMIEQFSSDKFIQSKQQDLSHSKGISESMQAQLLAIEVLNAEGLSGRSPDPFCVISFPSSHRTVFPRTCRTFEQKRTNSPDWNSIFYFLLLDSSVQNFLVQVGTKGLLRERNLGQTYIEIPGENILERKQFELDEDHGIIELRMKTISCKELFEIMEESQG